MSAKFIDEPFLTKTMDKAVFQKPPRCGLGKCHPPCLQVFKNIQSFTFFLCIFAVMSGMFPMYLVSQITTIEKHFDMPSQRSGMIVSAGEIGFLIAVVFVGHFLNTSHRPRVLAGCAFAIGASSILMTLPFFIYGTPREHDSSQTTEELSRNSRSSSSQLCQRNQSQLDLFARCDNTTRTGVGNGDAAFGIFLSAAVLAGCGATGLWSIGIAFLDDNAGKKEAALYIGFMFCLRSIAPVLGLMLGAGVSHIAVDLQDHHLSPEHSSWIGAWWIGFLAIGVITILAGLPLLFYPRELPIKDMDRNASTAETNLMRERRRSVVERAAEKSKTLLKSFPESVWKLLRNRVFLVFIIGSMFDVGAGVGYMAFGPKYIESQFHVDTFTANSITAGIVFSGALGMGLSGLLTSRIKMSLNDIFLRAVIGVAVFYTLILGLMSFGCPEVHIPGYTDLEVNSSGSVLTINETCHQCFCPDGQYEPVCGSNGLTYYSPCQAGCDAGGSDIGYSGCDCVGGNLTSTSGACPSECGMLIPYAVCLIVLSFFTNLTVMPLVMVSIRCMDGKDKSLALALINIAISIGILPVPVLYGSLLDSLCLVTESPSSCSQDESGLCLVYDNDAIRYSLHGLTFGIRFMSPLLYMLCWYLSRNMVFAGDETDEQKEPMQELKTLVKEKEKGEIIEPENSKPVIAV
ncbi:solute carrier organic anion transporter family member 4A1-like [Lineus longissimus]|uniref:solute carrier organic anion transporter family member 4A1-like n=1 Tax=Lineus longissimus TaxID=88925 RepID=UPI00315C9EE7